MLPSLNGNWVDFVILIAIAFFLYESYRSGFWSTLTEFLGFIGSFIVGFWGYKYISILLKSNFSLSNSLANAIGFMMAAIIGEVLISYFLLNLVAKLPEKIRKNKFLHFITFLPAIGQSIILITFLFTIFFGIPVFPQVKDDITRSKIGSVLLKQSSLAEKKVKEVFGGIIEDSITYLTIKPGTKESVPLHVQSNNLSIDEKAEKEMLNLINEERRKEGVSPLTWSDNIVPVARKHATDMWERKYFSHYSPEGKDVGDRLLEGKVTYKIAGENLALAPTLSTAHEGLMNSEGHRANILEKRFKKVGIGVIDNGNYGKMFVQVFTD